MNIKKFDELLERAGREKLKKDDMCVKCNINKSVIGEVYCQSCIDKHFQKKEI